MFWFKNKDKIKKCDNCKKQHTMQCPNSIKCYNTKEKPHFESKGE